MLTAMLLMIVSVVVMALIALFIMRVNREVQRQQREKHFGDISHVRIPDDLRDLESQRKPKPPYRPF